MTKLGEITEVPAFLCEKSNFDLEDHSLAHYVVLTSYPRNVSILNLQNLQVVKEWTLKGNNKLSSAAVIDKKTKILTALTEQKVLRSWHEKDDTISKDKKNSLTSPAYKILGCRKNGIVLYENGTFTTLENVNECFGQHLVSEEENIVWAHSLEIAKDTCITFVTKDKKTGHFKAFTYKFAKDLYNPQLYQCAVAKPDPDVTCLSHCVQCLENQLYLNTLWSNGDISRVNLATKGSPQYNSFSNIPCIDPRLASITVLDQSQLLVCGIKSPDDEIGVGVWDMRFDVLQAFQSLPEKNFTKMKVHFYARKAVLATDKGLYICPIITHMSNLSTVLGKFKSSETTNISHKVTEGIQKAVNNSTETSQESHLLLMSHATMLIDMWVEKASNNSKFKIPSGELHQLIKNNLISGNDWKKLLPVMISSKNIHVIYECFCKIQNISESSVIQCLNFYLSCEDDVLGEAMKEINVTKPDEEMEDHAISHTKAFYVNQLLKLPYNDVFLLECLRNLPFEDILTLVGYLHELLAATICDSTGDKGPSEKPSLLQVVDWIIVLFDSHFTQMILSREARPLLLELHQSVQDKMEFFDELNSLEAILAQMKEKCALPKHSGVGPYCIEILHL